MIQSLFRETPASSLQCNKGAIHRYQKSSRTAEQRRARGGTVPDTIHLKCDARIIHHDFLLK